VFGGSTEAEFTSAFYGSYRVPGSGSYYFSRNNHKMVADRRSSILYFFGKLRLVEDFSEKFFSNCVCFLAHELSTLFCLATPAFAVAACQVESPPIPHCITIFGAMISRKDFGHGWVSTSGMSIGCIVLMSSHYHGYLI
jgi:hypothetical protein